MYKKEDEVQEIKNYHYFEQKVTNTVHHFFISSVVDRPDLWVDMIFRIQTAPSTDTVVIHLNTPGGQLRTGVQLINAMRSSQAHIICSLESEVASLGTMIFLAADEFVVHDDCMMMFHNYSGGVFGKGHEQTAALEAMNKWTDQIMKRLYIPFMTEDEVERLKRGEDMYFLADEIRERLERMVKILEQEEKEKEENADKKTTRKKRTTKKRASQSKS